MKSYTKMMEDIYEYADKIDESNAQYSRLINKLASGITNAVIHNTSSSKDDFWEAATELHKLKQFDQKKLKQFSDAIRAVLVKHV